MYSSQNTTWLWHQENIHKSISVSSFDSWQHIYHFYVIAAEKDTHWVLENLLPVLESEPSKQDQAADYHGRLQLFLEVGINIELSHFIQLLLILLSMLAAKPTVICSFFHFPARVSLKDTILLRFLLVRLFIDCLDSQCLYCTATIMMTVVMTILEIIAVIITFFFVIILITSTAMLTPKDMIPKICGRLTRPWSVEVTQHKHTHSHMETEWHHQKKSVKAHKLAKSCGMERNLCC